MRAQECHFNYRVFRSVTSGPFLERGSRCPVPEKLMVPEVSRIGPQRCSTDRAKSYGAVANHTGGIWGLESHPRKQHPKQSHNKQKMEDAVMLSHFLLEVGLPIPFWKRSLSWISDWKHALFSAIRRSRWLQELRRLPLSLGASSNRAANSFTSIRRSETPVDYCLLLIALC